MLPRSFDAWRLGIEPVHDPAGVLPAELDGESKNQRLDHACWRQIVQRPMAELRHREDMGEIKEQFLMGDVRMARRHAAAGVNDDRRCLPLLPSMHPPDRDNGKRCRNRKDDEQDRQFVLHQVAGMGHAHPHVDKRDDEPDGNEPLHPQDDAGDIAAPELAEQGETAKQDNAPYDSQQHVHVNSLMRIPE